MRLIITNSINTKEYGLVKDTFALEIVKEASKKALKGLGVTIKSTREIHGTLLKIVYLTTSTSAGRVIFLLIIEKQIAILVMVRKKNDKKIGSNMTIKNPVFENTLKKYLDLILEDIEAGHFEENEL